MYSTTPHPIGKIFTQRLERNSLTLRTKIKSPSGE
ncbi:IS1 family transposase [Pectobacterium actinidiae]